MARQDVDIGVEGNDGTGDSIRESFRKVNENFQELYAVFGIGGQISFTDLSDTPDTYEGNENKVPTVKSDGSGLNLLELASDNSLDGSADTIGFDFSQDGKLIVRQLVSKVSNDPEPSLSGPLNAATQAIAGVSVTQDAIDTFNSVYGTDYTTSDLVINKSFADRNYQGKEVAGGGLRLGDEPVDANSYTLTADSISLGNLIIPSHGLTDAFNGAEFIFRTTGTPPFGVTNEGSVYLRIIDGDTIALYNSEQDALEGTGRILLSGGTGTFTITDGAYDPSIPGNWLSNVALPRKSVVRRQGDTMTGALNLFDHPGELAGTGLPNGVDDLQAASKLYVDNVAASSEVNIYVSTSGNDLQTFTPDGKEGRAPGYAYRTINAAAEKAEELQAASPFEPGPYMQTLTYNTGLGTGQIVTAGITSPIAGRTNARTLILENKEFIAKEVTGYINATFPDFADKYDIEICQRDVEYILDSVSLDTLLGNNANYLSRWAGIRYYSNVSARTAIGTQRVQTIAGIEYAKTLVTQYILTNTPPPTVYQDRVSQYIEPLIVPDTSADESIGDKFDIVLDVIRDGVLDAPPIVDGQTTYKINIGNGNFGFIDQANPENTDIIPGKVVRGKSSGALGRIIDYKYESGPRAVSVASTDEIEVQLLKPIEFAEGEELEYGNIVRENQITIRVETGIYEEDFPIRLAPNVSLKGDEFRRTIIRPKNRISQSRWANLFFYRDAQFDGLVLGKSSIEEFENLTTADVNRAAGTYTVSTFTTNNLGKDAVFEITVSSSGAIANIEIVNPGTDFFKNERITISDDDLGGGGAPDATLEVTKVPNGIEYVNPLTGAVDGYFGNHYLLNPALLKNTGAGYENVGKWETAALALIDNRELIQEQVVNYVEDQYPALIGSPGYSRTKCARDAGLIVDALVKDMRNGGNEFSLEAQGEYYSGAVDTGTEIQTVAGIQHIATLAKKIIRGLAPDTLYGVGLEYSFDDFNGDGDPAEWESGITYRLGNVVKATFAGVDRYYTPTEEHVSGDVLDAAEIAEYWREIDGPETVIDNLVDTVAFAFDPEYNPPLRNDQMDVFLMNDATMLRNITGQGHGGFQMVLDPEGQVLTKSPYCQTGSGFAKSDNKQAFRGGLFVDAFVGNSAVRVTEKVDGSPFRLRIQSLGSQDEPQGLFVRRPETPCAFYIDGRRFQVNAVTQYDPDFGTAELILDPSSNEGQGFTGLTSELATGVDLDSLGTFEFDEEKCKRDTRIILGGVGYDTVLGTNFNSVINGLAYRRSYSSEVIDNQLTETIAALTVGKTSTLALEDVASSALATTRAGDAWDEVIDILENGIGAADALVFSDPGIDINRRYARELLQLNRDFIATELTTWIAANQPGNTYNASDCERDTKLIVDALSYDIQYGGNSGTIVAAQAYFEGAVSILPDAQKPFTAAAFTQLASIVSDIVTESYAGQVLNGGNVASATEATQASDLVTIIVNVVEDDTLSSLPTTVFPNVTWALAELQTAQNNIIEKLNVIVNDVVQSVDSPIPITLQTAGNRSILGNDFTQINDQGYGLVAVNGALSEMVSMFTYYCHTSYYAKNGAEIRSLTGSSCYGEFGLVAEGSDPNEIPDAIQLYEDMTQPGKVFSADVILTTTSPLSLAAGDELEQAGTGATGIVAANTGQAAEGSSGSTVIYLTNTTGAFDTSNEISITGPIAGDSTITALGAGSVPLRVDSTGYGNNRENLAIHVYDMKDPPSNRSEFDVYHPLRPAFARYEVANVEVIDHIVGGYYNVGTEIPLTFVPGPDATGTHASALFLITKTVTNGYEVTISNKGTDYAYGDSFTVDGADLGGVSGVNDATITVTQVDEGDSTLGAGEITEVEITGDIYIEPTTPTYNGIIYKLNFSTSDAQFSDTGLLEDVPYGVLIQYRRNQTHIISDLARPDVLTIRPSTALIFGENPDFVYRSISFLTSNSIGTELPEGVLQAGFDSSYDYIRLLVDSAKAQESDLAGTGTTKGNTVGDVRIACLPVADDNEIYRLNNNSRTPEANRPIGWTADSLSPAPIITWQGKKHYVFNYRGVQTIGGVETEVSPAEDNEYAIVDLQDVGDEINYPASATGLASSVVLGSELVTLRAGLQAGAIGDVTINISTCRATSHDFLDIGTGGFNASNYPNVIFGQPAEKNDANEVDERGKGRVFYVSTDQNGIFRVGRFFSVDQGTGTVTFSASIALSDVDGLGFKRGVVVTEFSTDTAMTDNASDTVPTELAVRGYVNRRLGYDVNGNPVANKLGPGVLAPNGAVPMTDDLNAAGNTITNLAAPATASDAATKAYVDAGVDGIDEIKDLRSVEYNDYEEGQLLVGTGYKKLIIDAGSVVGGPFERNDTITGTISGATGTIVDVRSTTGLEGNIVEVIYEPLTGEFSDGKPASGPDPDVITVLGGAEGLVLDGPVDEWANGVWNVASDITVTTNREVTVDGSEVTDRYTTLNMQIKANTIVNSDVNASANISQSKLNLNPASTRLDAVAISQADLGVAAFDSAVFTTTDGWTTIQNGQLPLEKIERISDGHVLGNWSGDSSDNDIDELAFSTVITEGGGLVDNDFTSIIDVSSDPGNALIETATGVYAKSNVTNAGEVNSILKTDANGSIQVNSIILGGNNTYEVLALDTLDLVLKTPAQGEILRAVGGSGGASPTYPDIEMAGSLNISNTGVDESVLQNTSTLNGEKVLGVDWIYSSFIEAAQEKGAASTGIAIGAGTGITTTGQVAIVTADSGTSSSVAPMIFDSNGVLPDTDDQYNIGSASQKYANVYATLFRGTATESYYADLAENYLGDADYEPGTVLVFGGDVEVTTTTSKGDRRVAGVVTTNPAHLMNSQLEGDNVTGIALQGRVPCKVLGKVNKGDLLVTSAIPGYAMVDNDAKIGTVIGKALENKDDTDRGTIEVVVGKH